MAIAIVLIVGVGLAVIVGLALLRYPRDQWGERMRTTTHMVMNGVGLPRLDGRVRVREVTLDEMWAETSKVGNAYWEMLSFENRLDRFRQIAEAQSKAPAASAEAAPVRASIAARFPKVTSLHRWRSDADESEGSERTVA